MSFGFPIPRDRKSRVTRREGDSATHGARFRLVSDNDDVKHTRVFDSDWSEFIIKRGICFFQIIKFWKYGKNYFTAKLNTDLKIISLNHQHIYVGNSWRSILHKILILYFSNQFEYPLRNYFNSLTKLFLFCI